MAGLPIIVLAFANEQEGRRYLRDLPEELRRLQEILEEAERNGLCRLKLLPNASLDQIFDVFTRNRDQISILHYAGHADSGRLLLESSAAGGCPRTRGRAGEIPRPERGAATGLPQRLLDPRPGHPAARRGGCLRDHDGTGHRRPRGARISPSLSTPSWPPASRCGAAYELAHGRDFWPPGATFPGRITGHRELGDSPTDACRPDPADDHGFPWEFRPGTELVERWSLPDAAGNPEFGLPKLPMRDLPICPFRHLAWFTAEHAEVFFGRGYADPRTV